MDRFGFIGATRDQLRQGVLLVALFLLPMHVGGCGDADASTDAGGGGSGARAAPAGDGGGDGRGAGSNGGASSEGCRSAGARDDADAGGDGAALYVAAAEVLTVRCAQARCHGPVPAYELLELTADRCDLTRPLLDVPACEYDLMDRVEPGQPERSWLWLKLTAPHDERYQLQFEPDDAWSPSRDPRCAEAGFGTRMPPPGFPLSDAERETIRAWILAGAPGPG